MIPVIKSVPSSAKPLHTAKQQHVAQRLLEILDRPSAPGRPLPGERELAVRLGVSRRTVRTVMKWLEQRGHVRTIPFHGRHARSAESRSTLSDTICLLGDVPAEAIPSTVRADGWFDTVQYAAAAELRVSDFHTLVLQIERINSERCARLVSDRPAGLVLFQHFASVPKTREIAAAFNAARVPFVVHSDDPTIEDYDFVCSDHDDGAYRLAKFLIERGCRRILRCWLVPPDIAVPAPWLSARSRGSEHAIREAGLEVLPLMEARCELRDRTQGPRESFEHGVRVAAGYLMDHLQHGRRIDAIMAPSDFEALCMAAACRKFGVIPGKDILITGYDNNWADVEARQWEPYLPAATMDKQNAEIGRELVRLLVARINGTLPLEPQRRIISPNLVVPVQP